MKESLFGNVCSYLEKVPLEDIKKYPIWEKDEEKGKRFLKYFKLKHKDAMEERCRHTGCDAIVRDFRGVWKDVDNRSYDYIIQL